MFHTRVRGGKAFAAEQKIREFKKLLLKMKNIIRSDKKRLKPNDVIKKVTYNMNNTRSPLSQFAHNLVYKELTKLKNYYTFAKSDERLYVHLRRGRGYTQELEKIVRNDSSLKLTITLKTAVTKKMRLRVVGYHQGEYMYSMTNLGLLVSYKDYGIVAQNSLLSTNV